MLEGKYEKNGVPKVVKLTLSRNMSKQKQNENAGKGTQKKCKRKMNWKNPEKKNGLKWKWKETRKEDQSSIGPSRDEKWSLV